jgi:hypothetical protein
VIRSGSTDREFTLAKMEPVQRLPIRPLGVVVNDFEPTRLEGHNYYPSYLPGYEAGSEDEVGMAHVAATGSRGREVNIDTPRTESVGSGEASRSS